MFDKAIKLLKRAWAVAPVATVLLAFAVVASIYFGVRSAIHPMRVEREQSVAAWMTPRYIARSWSLPPEIIQNALDVPRPRPKGPISLRQLAELRSITVEQIIAEAEAAIAAFRQDKLPLDEGVKAND